MILNCRLFWLAEHGDVKKDSVFQDQEGNRIVFTGKSFQAIEECEDKYIGMCAHDVWKKAGMFDKLYE